MLESADLARRKLRKAQGKATPDMTTGDAEATVQPSEIKSGVPARSALAEAPKSRATRTAATAKPAAKIVPINGRPEAAVPTAADEPSTREQLDRAERHIADLKKAVEQHQVSLAAQAALLDETTARLRATEHALADSQFLLKECRTMLAVRNVDIGELEDNRGHLHQLIDHYANQASHYANAFETEHATRAAHEGEAAARSAEAEAARSRLVTELTHLSAELADREGKIETDRLELQARAATNEALQFELGEHRSANAALRSELDAERRKPLARIGRLFGGKDDFPA